MNSGNPKDDALFDALGKSRKKKRRKIIRTVIIILVVIAIALVAGVMILQRKVREQFASAAAEVLSYEVVTGSISTVVSGSGTLTNVDTETVSLPSGVELEEILVSYGDNVTEGDLLATVDMASVRSAMSDLQSQIEELDEQISEAEADEVSSYIKAGVSGRVKVIYVREGMEVADSMMAQGALAILSLDGYMAVDISTDKLQAGDSVQIVLDDQEYAGIVEAVINGTATVLVTDNGPANAELATVKADDGTTLGSGALYVHDPLAVTGYAGTVSKLYVEENDKVSQGSKLFYLENTESSVNYDALLRQRSEAEQTLLELLQIQYNGGIIAPIDGSIFSVADLDSEEEITEVAAISPDVSMSVTITVDEADILSLELDQQAEVTVSSVSDDILVGTVTQVDKTASAGYYTAVITLDKIEGMLPGMTASVDVRIEGVDDAMIIPLEALHRTSTGAYVYTSYDEQTQTYGGKVDVVVGLSNSNFVQILSGLEEGRTYYYPYYDTLVISDVPQMGGFPFGR